MKDRVSCLEPHASRRIVCAVFAAAVVMVGFTASAAWTGKTYTWTGDAGDGKWSTPGNWKANGAEATQAPTESDALVFNAGVDDTCIDENFTPTRVYSLTLDTGFGGTVRMQRDFTVAQEYRQRAGTFICGEHIFQCGIYGGTLATVATYGHFYLNGGTFDGPVNQAFRWYSKSHVVDFIVDDVAGFDCSKADFKMYIASQGGTLTFTCANRTFKTFELMQASNENSAKTTVNWLGTNTVLKMFTHAAGLFGGGKNVNYGASAFYLEGDLVLKGYPQGMTGNGGMHFILTNALNQTITTSIATNKSYATAALLIDKPAGTVTVTGDRFNITDASGPRHYGFNVKRGTVDMSGLKWFALSSYNTEFHVWDEATVIWPERVQISNFSCNLRVKDQTFNSLRLHSSDSSIDFGYATTNTVTGWLECNGFGFNGVNDAARYPESTQTGVKPVLRLLGPGINVITNTSTYSGFLNSCKGDGELWLCSDADQVITVHDSRLYLSTIIVDKPADKSVTVESDDGILPIRARGGGTVGGHLKILSGTFYGPTRRIDFSSYGSRFVEGPSGTYVCRGAVLNFTSWDGGTELRSPVAGVICNLSDVSGMPGNGLTVAKGTVLTVTNSFEGVAGNLKSGGTGARMDLSGDFAITGYNFGKSTSGCPIRFVGDRDQHVSIIEDGTNTTGQITVAKTGGKLVLDTDVNLVKGTPALVHESGMVDVNGHRVTTKGEIVLHGGATLGVPAAPEVNELPWVATTGQLTEKNATAADPFAVHLTNARSYFDGPTLTGRVNVFGYGSFEKNTTHDPKRFTATASRGVSKRSKVLDDADDKILYLNYRINEGTLVFVK